MTRRPTRSQWLGLATIVWAVVLIGAAVYSSRHGKPTVREQTTVVQALPTVDRALTAVLAGTSGTQTVGTVGGYDLVRTRCDAGNRDGEQYQRTLNLYTQPGTESDLLSRISAALPKSYGSSVSDRALTADAGFFVTLDGVLIGPGELRFVADTGCRVRGGAVPGPDAAAPAAAVAAADDLVGRLGVSVSDAGSAHLGCGTPGGLGTATRVGPPPDKALSGLVPPGATVLISHENLVVYRTGPAVVVASRQAAEVRIAASAGC